MSSSLQAMSDLEVAQKLDDMHGIDWGFYFEEKAEVALILRRFADDPDSIPTSSEPTLRTKTQLSERALSELGHFVVSSDGRILPSYEALFERLKSQIRAASTVNDSTFAALEFLKNANTPETVNFLLEMSLKGSEKMSQTSLSLLQTCLADRPPVQSGQMDAFAIGPHLYKDFESRGRADAWRKVLSNAAYTFGKLLERKNLKGPEEARLRQLQQASLTLSAGDPEQKRFNKTSANSEQTEPALPLDIETPRTPAGSKNSPNVDVTGATPIGSDLKSQAQNGNADHESSWLIWATLLSATSFLIFWLIRKYRSN